MAKKHDPSELSALPACAGQFIRHVIKKMRYGQRARDDVQAELADHFAEELRACTDPEERERRARRLIEEFGDPALLAALCRRAKKRCRHLWVKTLVRTAQACGVCVLLFGVYLVWFVSGKAHVRVDYLAVLNQMSRPQIAEPDNAWPHYQQAMALLVEPNDELAEVSSFDMLRVESRDFASLSAREQQLMAAWVEASRSAWEQFQAGSVKPYCWRPYELNDSNEPQWLLSLLLPHIKPLKQLASLGIWRCRMEMQQGQTAAALEDCLTVARAGRHWQQSGLLIEQLVGLGLSRAAHVEVLRILSRRSLAATDLAELQRRMAALYPGAYPLINIEGERMGFLDTVQRMFTEGGPGGGHLIPGRMASLSTEPEDGELLGVILWTAAIVHAGRNQTVAKAEELFELGKKRMRLTPYEKRGCDLAPVEDMLMSLPWHRYTLIRVLAPAVERAAELAFQGRALHQATVTILALRRYHAEKGAFPASLDELQRAGYLNVLPADPYSNGPLSYKAAHDNFVLYSVGPNFHDDGGRPGSMGRKRSTLWRDDGDAVFWPVNP